MDKGDGIAVGWLGHPFRVERKKGAHFLYVVCRPFLKTFPVVLVDSDRIGRGDLPFRRAESK